MTVILATATLASSYVYARNYGIPYDLYTSTMSTPYLYNDNKFNDLNVTSTSCNARGSVGHSLHPICGSWDLDDNFISMTTVTSYWIWAVWANCTIWLLICLLKHCQDSYESRWLSVQTVLTKLTWIRSAVEGIGRRAAWTILSLLLWSLCFGYQYFLFSVYFKHSVISQQWSFGQIIAVTVWVPSIVEYVYIEYSLSNPIPKL